MIYGIIYEGDTMNNKKEIKVTCDDIDYQLNGVARYNDKVIFIEGILPGEEAIVEVFKETKKFSFAKVKTIISESDVRVNPICENYFDCGGCDLMHIEYVEQLRMKKQMVQNELLRNKLSHIKLCDPIGMEYPFEYRNKVSVPIREVNGNVSCGFYKKKSHEIVEFGKCYVQPNTSNDIVTFVRNYISDNKLSCYNEKLGKGGLRHIIIRSSVDGKYMVTLVVNERFDLEIDSLASALVKQFECMETIVLNVNTKKSNVILGDEEVILHGDGYILDRYDNKVFKVGSKSFFQINSTQAVKLYDKASELFGVDKKKVLIDLYCGDGPHAGHDGPCHNGPAFRDERHGTVALFCQVFHIDISCNVNITGNVIVIEQLPLRE